MMDKQVLVSSLGTMLKVSQLFHLSGFPFAEQDLPEFWKLAWTCSGFCLDLNLLIKATCSFCQELKTCVPC